MANNHPDLIFLMETKLHASQYHFLKAYKETYSAHTINCSVNGGGKAGGLAIIWNHCTLNMTIINSDLYYVDMLISNPHNTQNWRATEKFGGNTLEPNITSSFRNTISHCDLQDLGYNGSIYTWTNRQPGEQLIKSRLDRFLATSNWTSMFPKYANYHLVRYRSDHCPILLEFSQDFRCRTNNPKHYCKRFEQIWTTDEQHTSIVMDAWNNKQGGTKEKLQHTLNALRNWGRKTFGIIPTRIKETQQALETLQLKSDTQRLNQQIKAKEKELDDLLEKEEMWWSHRSRALWLTHGDKNTKFFHLKASQRRKKNSIDSIKDPNGLQHSATFLNHFQQLFTSQPTTLVNETVQVVKNKITQDMYDHLSEDFTAEEVFNAIKDMKILVAPGPDGLPAKFYHTYWDIIGNDITKMALQVLNHEGNPEPFNTTHICLIPKITNPSQPSEFRPISLCNVTLKIITKTIANRIKTILPDIISPNQSAFVPGRLITDNSLIANEIFHYLSQTTRQTGFVGIKTDMAKAYDRLEWDFLQATLESMNFPTKMTNNILKCVSTVSFSILINGKPSRAFSPKRGLRQGDPLSPYLFIICVDVLSALISKAQNNKFIHGVKVAPRAPEITHLFFADDSLMFCRATKDETTHMKALITTYQQASVDHFSKYLGQPTFIGKYKNQAFNYIQDRVWKKLKGWKERNLSFAGRGTLIKVVAQAIPTYLMSCFLLPKGLCNHMEGLISRFWWGSNVDQRKIHW
ncbi:hypothetical protein A2U01_0001148, partial [Trifolium medium]|nr:hypothetical protein [Trifolium medium]